MQSVPINTESLSPKINLSAQKGLPTVAGNIPELLTIQQAAKLCGLGRNNFAYFVRKSLIPVVIFPGMKRVRIHQSDLIDFINSYKFIHRSQTTDHR